MLICIIINANPRNVLTGWRRSHRPSLHDISIIDEEEERDDPGMKKLIIIYLMESYSIFFSFFLFFHSSTCRITIG